jgi:hypothetical protein
MCVALVYVCFGPIADIVPQKKDRLAAGSPNSICAYVTEVVSSFCAAV